MSPTALASAAGKPSDPWASEEEIAGIDKWARGMKLRKGSKKAVIISDLVSADPDKTDPDATLQWVNLVMAGGGMLGIAHVGFMRVLEQAGIRFIGLGGASAGAINAALTAAVRQSPDKTSWEELAKILGEVRFYEFEDGDSYFVKMRKRLVEKGLELKRLLVSLFWHRRKVGDAISSIGLHKGDEFISWLKTQMAAHDVTNTEQLLLKMQLANNDIRIFRPVATVSPEGPTGEVQYQEVTAQVEGPQHDRLHYPLRLVASEVTTQSMIVFPRDADMFYGMDSVAPPADFVRASMSVPIFFKPFCIPYIDPKTNTQHGTVYDAGSTTSRRWDDRLGYKGRIPQTAMFCDGGTLSNFPMQLFAADLPTSENGAPLCPIIGVRLSQDRSSDPEVKDTGAYLGSMFDTARNLLDREFLFKNPAYANWVGTVNTAGFDWLGFDMTPATRSRLLLEGMRAGKKFLEQHVVTFKDQKKGAPGPPSEGSPAIAADATKPAPKEAAGQQGGAAARSEWENYKLIKQLQGGAAAVQEREYSNKAARTMLLQNLDLENEFNTYVAPAMDELQDLKNELGEAWAYGIFLPGFDKDRREQILKYRRATQTFWRKVQAAYEPKPGQLQVITKDWWTSNWLGRGRSYRLLVEPLDIANWYGSNPDEKMSEKGHYIDLLPGSKASIGPALEDEMAADNKKRPGRYLMLQRLEAAPKADKHLAAKFNVASMKSSLTTARYLKEQVGDMSWNEYVSTLGSQ